MPHFFLIQEERAYSYAEHIQPIKCRMQRLNHELLFIFRMLTKKKTWETGRMQSETFAHCHDKINLIP